ncbi:MAG: bifunctional UDP-N-acetylglucosamine diphosphorylase/glucosamine-1-phosphate N-acetyltransferase GlmU [Deltaproteobacteria bacterium]|nr:bifunctional UDP-N-acetylglucosamine diphosphorylase/glucosamine-1-phosphate N-acetyltransferase GlmU [Deltaproteobacteria bacterium]MBW2359706.1 bifunctional UDP-N-acetylglucosamine diphosphorylase/glucosamine-1-phosphate N-acetyltransferase GlmU [Deltaproteobacteria bacterium]
MSRIPSLAVLVLAAGQGTRMRSRLAKVLHPLCGRPLLHHTLAAGEALGAERLVVVVGRDSDNVRQRFAGRARFAQQDQQLGTGHAVLQSEAELAGFSGDVLVLNGDLPLVRAETLERMLAFKQETAADLVILSGEIDVPGILVRAPDGALARVVEATDATPAELAIAERNTGVYLIERDLLWKCLAQVDAENAQGEIYLTSIVEILLAEGRRVEVLRLQDDSEGIGVNTRVDLAEAAALMRARILNRLMLAGVTVVDPATTYIDVDVEVGQDTVIEPNCVIQGQTSIGEGCHVKANCVIEDSSLANDVEIGPSAHLRPGTSLGEGVRIGNYVEVKNSQLAAGVKADHLSYIGDADVGEGASFGCGAITVNYDWRGKHRTRVAPGAVVGCNVNLIAPVSVGRNAAIAAGSTITKDVPDDSLALGRSRDQKHVAGWSRRKRPEDKLK